SRASGVRHAGVRRPRPRRPRSGVRPGGRELGPGASMSLLDRVLGELSRRGLLLKQDKRPPNVVGLVTGGALSTSWWGHPEGGRIFGVLEELDDHADVLCTKLLSGKDTFVHRRLWPSLLAVAAAREPWQQLGLTPEARRLLASVDGGSEAIRA